MIRQTFYLICTIFQFSFFASFILNLGNFHFLGFINWSRFCSVLEGKLDLVV